MSLCQLECLPCAGIPEHQINTVIEIARHIRDEASQKVDAEFDKKAILAEKVIETTDSNDPFTPVATGEESCGCTPTPGGQFCC